jgi:hypothetical protein
MSTRAITGYFAFLLGGLAAFGAYLMLQDLFAPGGTPWNWFYLFVCLGLFGVANRLAAQRRWAVALFVLLCLLGFSGHNKESYLVLAHLIAGVLLLIFRWRELKPGL